MTRHNLPGPFAATKLNSGLWQLAAQTPDGAHVYLRGAQSEASKLLADARIASLELEWRSDGVVVRVKGAEGVRHFMSESVFVHTPKTQLYDSLPLAGFDARARRFWKRVFWLMRIPGGRLALGAIARRRPGTASH